MDGYLKIRILEVQAEHPSSFLSGDRVNGLVSPLKKDKGAPPPKIQCLAVARRKNPL